MQRVEWFSDVHYEILSFFQEHDILIAPRDLGDNIGYDRQYVSRACGELAEAGFLRRPKRGQYGLSQIGHRYLTEGLSDQELEEMQP